MGTVHKPLKKPRFDVSLRFRHPTRSADEISAEFNLQPRFHWNVGDLRRKSDGSLGDGVRDSSYWSHEVASGKVCGLADALEENIATLEPHAAFLREFIASGGEVEYFIGLFTTSMSGGVTLSPELLRRIADLGINISIDV